jgi:tRNA A37 methylthiotransferase MiaB
MGSRESDRNDESSYRTLNSPTASTEAAQSAQEKIEEQRKIRRLQTMMDMVMSVISQDGSLTVDQAAELVADSKKAALAMFPDKELAYNIIYKPRLQRLMRERYRIQ